MKNLSIAADIAWRIAAHEAGASGFKFIEKEHLLIGIERQLLNNTQWEKMERNINLKW